MISLEKGVRGIGVKLRDRSKENTWGKSPIPLKIMNACFSIAVSWEKVNIPP